MSPDRAAGKNRRSLARRAAVVVFWLVVWQALAMFTARESIAQALAQGSMSELLRALEQGHILLLPAPVLVAETLFSLALTPSFWAITAASLLRIFSGFVAGAVLGGLIACLTAFLPWADTLFSPLIRIIRATPVASFIVLILLWVRTGMVPGVISALMVLPVVWGNVHAGLVSADGQLLEMADAYSLGPWRTLGLVRLPSALPHFASGCTTALGLAWKSGVAAEVLCLPRQAIGTQVYYSKLSLETPALFAWTAVVIVLSFALESLLRRALERLKGGRRWK